MKIRKRTILLVVAVVFYCAWTISPAFAHAELVHSVPEPNAVLDQSPPQVEVILSEPLESTLSTVKVYDTDGNTVDLGDASVDPSNSERMTVSLPKLPDGIYTVSWQALSQIDGHVTGGSFPFAVGKIAPSSLPAEQETTNTNLPISALIAKWLLLAAVALIAGLFPSQFFVWRPAFKSNADEMGLFNRLSSTWNILYKFGLAGILLACVLGVLAQAGQTTGNELALPWSKPAIQILTETRLGVIWLVRIVIVLIGIWITQSRETDWKEPARFGVGLALLFTISLTSHAATELHPLLPVLGDWLHLVGMSFWFGGLAYLISGLTILRKIDGRLRTRITAAMTKRFSLMALPSVGVVGLTGIYSAVLRVGSISALLDSLYGHSLLFKQIFVAVLLMIAAINLLIISPGIHRESLQDKTNSLFVQRFGRTVFVEVVMAGFLLASVSVLTYMPPARIPPPKTTLTAARKVDDIKIALSITPGLVGVNTFSVLLTPKRSAQVVKTVSLNLEPVSSGNPPSDLTLNAQGNGLFSAQGSNIGIPDERWQVQVSVQRENKFDALATFVFNVKKPSSTNETETTFFVRLSSGLIVLVLLLTAINIYIRLRKPKPIRSQSNIDPKSTT